MEKNFIVFFDLFNTLIRTTPPNGHSYQDLLVELGAPRNEIYPFVRDCLMTNLYDDYYSMVGKITSFFGLTCLPEEQRRVARCWKDENRSVEWVSGARRLLRMLVAEPTIFPVIITNCTFPGWKAARRILSRDFSMKDHMTYISCYEGYAKPDRRVWQKILCWYPDVGIRREFLMVGDSEADDLAVPRVLGWNTHLAKPDGSTLRSLEEKLLGKRGKK